MQDRIIIIDGNSLINRAYYAMQRPMMTKEGIYTQAIYGFLNMLSKIQREYEPEYMAVAWDLKAPTFRHKEYQDYKAGRRKMPIELAMQIPLMQEILDAMNIKNLYMEGYEADDIIGTLAKKSEEKGLLPLVITGDKDALQLASDKIHVLITKKGISEFDLYDRDKMLERYELTPEQFIDLKGLMGDQSDNIPGIPGVGEKTGINLLKQFGTIEEMLSRTDEISSPKLREKVEENANLARMSRRLAEIQLNVPLEVSTDELKVNNPDYDKLIELYSKLEFNSFLKKMQKGGSAEPRPATKKSKVNDAGSASSVDESDDGEGASSEKIEIPEIEIKEQQIILSKDDFDKANLEEILSKYVKQETGSSEHKSNVDSQGTLPLLYIKVFSDNNHVAIPEIIGISILAGDKYYYLSKEGVDAFIDFAVDNSLSISGHGLINDIYPMIMHARYKRQGNPKNEDARDLEFFVGFDTEIAAYLVNPSRSGYSLKALMMEEFHTEVPEEKEFLKEQGQINLFDNHDDEYSQYGRLITTSVARLEASKKYDIEEMNLDNVFYNVELPLVMVLAAMEAEGFKVNGDTLTEFGEELKTEIENLTQDIYSDAGEEFNINSPQQLGDILFDKLGLTAGKKTKKGYSTSAEILEKIYDEHPIVPRVLRYRTLTKLNGTYVDGLKPLIGFDERIRAHFQQTVTATGRISCTEPNLQNIPIRNEFGRQLRKAFVPRGEDRILIGADYSQIELRVLAHLSEDESLIEAFNRGDDIHRATAARVFGIPYDDVTALDRSKAKAVNFGVIYGMSGFGLSEELGITRREAENFIGDYFDKHPKVKAYMDLQIALAKERGYTETIMGRRRYIPEIKAPNYMVRSLGERLAMNSPIQGSAADIIKIAMANVQNELREKKLKSKLILQVHDELIIDADISEREVVEELLVRNMMNAMDLKVKLVSDLNTGSTWYDLK